MPFLTTAKVGFDSREAAYSKMSRGTIVLIKSSYQGPY